MAPGYKVVARGQCRQGQVEDIVIGAMPTSSGIRGTKDPWEDSSKIVSLEQSMHTAVTGMEDGH